MSTQPAWSEQEAELEALRLRVGALQEELSHLRDVHCDLIEEHQELWAAHDSMRSEWAGAPGLISAARSEHYECHPLDMRFCDVSPVCRIAWAMGA